MRVLNPSFLAVTVKFWLSDFGETLCHWRWLKQLLLSKCWQPHTSSTVLTKYQSEFKYYEIIFFSSLEFMEAVI